MKMHPDVTPDRILEAVERSHTTLDNPGFCISCGYEADSVEPDARRLTCESCGLPAVYGAEELLLTLT
jgi:hypothetical protein